MGWFIFIEILLSLSAGVGIGLLLAQSLAAKHNLHLSINTKLNEKKKNG